VFEVAFKQPPFPTPRMLDADEGLNPHTGDMFVASVDDCINELSGTLPKGE
jgi:hypothetical protein